MRAVIVFSDNQGNSWEYELRPSRYLAAHARISHDRPIVRTTRAPQQGVAIDFGLSISTFMNRHARGTSGARKFAILVARLAKGDTKIQVPSSEVERQWKKTTRHLGDFNGAHGTRAKDAGWVDTPKRGYYVLSNDWRGALSP